MVKTIGSTVSFLLMALLVASCAPKAGKLGRSFDGSSADLKATEIVPTLDSPIPEGRNAIWCASFQAAWKYMEKEAARGAISLDGSPQSAKLLNQSGDPGPHLPTGALYLAAGRLNNDFIARVAGDLKERYPSAKPPSFPEAGNDAFAVYSYLEANVGFEKPYFQNRKPFKFVSSDGTTNEIRSFGIRPEDDFAYYQLRAQPRVLFRKDDPGADNLEFAVDLAADSSPSQIIVARVGKAATLASTMAQIEKESNAMQRHSKKDQAYYQYLQEIGPNDVLLVPDMFWKISHRYSDIEGKAFKNTALLGLRLELAQQDIVFKLDRSGAELKSESKLVMAPVPTYFVLDRPFLVIMKKRGAERPYFVAWIENTELLQPWRGGKLRLSSGKKAKVSQGDGTNSVGRQKNGFKLKFGGKKTD